MYIQYEDLKSTNWMCFVLSTFASTSQTELSKVYNLINTYRRGLMNILEKTCCQGVELKKQPEFESASQLWSEDCNFGLAKQ